MEPVINILRTLNLPDFEAVCTNFNNENVTAAVVNSLSSDELKALGVTRLGDQVILKQRCRRVDTAPPTPAPSQSSALQSERSGLFRFLPKTTPRLPGLKRSASKRACLKFVCLSDRLTVKAPSSADKEELTLAGLGERVVEMPLDASAHQVADTLFSKFPKLKDAGGFTFLRLPSNSKTLTKVPVAESGYTATYLKEVTKTGRIFIRPIQRDLNLDPVEVKLSPSKHVQERCLTCGEMFPMSSLQQHVEEHEMSGDDWPEMRSLTAHQSSTAVADQSIGNKKPRRQGQRVTSVLPSTDVNPTPPQPQTNKTAHPSAEPSTSGSSHRSEINEGASTSSGPSERQSYRTYVEECLVLDQEEEMQALCDLDSAIAASLLEESMRIVAGSDDGRDISAREILHGLSSVIDDTKIAKFNINRKTVWDSGLRGFHRPSYCARNKMSVKFTDDIGTAEGAVDLGGPRREFLRLLMQHVRHCHVFEGHPDARNLSLSNPALQADTYFMVGRVMAVSLVHGGPSPTFLSGTLFDAITQGIDRVSPTMKDIHDRTLRQQLEDLLAAEDDAAKDAAVESLSSLMAVAGIVMLPSTKAKSVVDQLIRFYVLGRCHQAFERLCAGLNTLGVHEAVKKHPEVFRPIFVAPGEPTPLSADTVEQTFKIGQLSEEGSNARVKELQVIGHWRDLLQDIEDELSTLKFEDILVFSTGGDAVPAIGFVPEPTLAFATDGTRFPRGKTCANVLELPIVHDTYHKFKEEMEFGILNSTGFGMA